MKTKQLILTAAIKKCKLLVVCLLLLFNVVKVCSQQPEPIQVILDKDMGGDIDDAYASSMLYAKQDRGEVELLAINVASGHTASLGAAAAIQYYYGHNAQENIDDEYGMPIGVLKNTPWRTSWLFDGYTKMAEYPNLYGNDDSEALNSVDVYRKTLATAFSNNDSIEILAIGFLSNLQKVLESLPDRNSPLTGEQLVQRTIKKITWLGYKGLMSNGTTRRGYNSHAAGHGTITYLVLQTLDRLGIPICFVFEDDANGIESGAIMNGSTVPIDENHPNHMAQAEWEHITGDSSKINFDGVAALALFDKDRRHYDEENVIVAVLANGGAIFNPNPNGIHTVLVQRSTDEQIMAAIDSLMAAPRKVQQTNNATVTFDDGSIRPFKVTSGAIRFAKREGGTGIEVSGTSELLLDRREFDKQVIVMGIGSGRPLNSSVEVAIHTQNENNVLNGGSTIVIKQLERGIFIDMDEVLDIGQAPNALVSASEPFTIRIVAIEDTVKAYINDELAFMNSEIDQPVGIGLTSISSVIASSEPGAIFIDYIMIHEIQEPGVTVDIDIDNEGTTWLSLTTSGDDFWTDFYPNRGLFEVIYNNDRHFNWEAYIELANLFAVSDNHELEVDVFNEKNGFIAGLKGYSGFHGIQKIKFGQKEDAMYTK